MEHSRHDEWNDPIRVHLAFIQTQPVEMVMWQVQYVKRQELRSSLRFTQCKQEEAANRLPVTETMTLPVYQTEPFIDVTVNWDSHAVQTCHVTSSAGGKIAPRVYILPHKIIVTCEIIFFVYAEMLFSCSLKMFGWR